MKAARHGEYVTEDNETFGKSFWKQSKNGNELNIWGNILASLFLRPNSIFSQCFHSSNFFWKGFEFLLQTQNSLLRWKLNLFDRTSLPVERNWRQNLRILFRTWDYIHVQTRKFAKNIKRLARGSPGTPSVAQIANVAVLLQTFPNQMFGSAWI